MTTRTIADIQAELETRIVAGSDIIQPEKLKGTDKRQNDYIIGCLLNELRELFTADQEYGEAVGNFWSGITDRHPDRKIPAAKTVFNYRRLSSFGVLWECELVGFTNVYRLMEEAQEENRAIIKEQLAEINPYDMSDSTSASKVLVISLKDTLKEMYKKPTRYSEEETLALVEAARGVTSTAERTALRQEGLAAAYYEYLEIDPEDAEDNPASLRAMIKSSTRRLSRKYHPDANLDSPERFANEFQFVERIKQFFEI